MVGPLLFAIYAKGLLQNNPNQVPNTLPSNGIITQSLQLNGGYTTRPETELQPALTISTDGITVDFGGVLLRSSAHPTDGLETKAGIGLLLKNCKNVTIKNLKARGYQYNIAIQNCQNITLENVNASYSKAELMVQNDAPINSFLDLRNLDSWRTYGSGIWIENSQDCTVQGCDSSDSQNGIILMNSNGCHLINNTCMFNSGWGIAMGNSVHNQILWNHLDFCNRRWGQGWGGDSAALALSNGCHENLIVGNSMTHSGDGFFLSDKVNGGFNDKDQTFHFEGGSNDNIISDSDGSYSTANAFEDTFSDRNIFYKDQANSSRYGFWIGFSNDTFIGDCSIQNNEVDGIAGGQGARARIENNEFVGNGHLDGNFWSDPGAAQMQKPSADLEIALKGPFDPSRWEFKNSSASIFPANQGSPTLVGAPSDKTPKLGAAARILERIGDLLAPAESSKPADWLYYSQSDWPKSNDWLTISTYGPFDFRNQLAAIHKEPGFLAIKPLRAGLRIEIPNDFEFGSAEDQSETVVQPKAGSGVVSRYLPYTVQITDPNNHSSQVVSGAFMTQAWQSAWFDIKAMPDFVTNGTPQPYSAFKALLGSKPTYSAQGTPLNIDPPSSGDTPQGPLGPFILLAKTGFILPTGTLSIRINSNCAFQLFIDGKELLRSPAGSGLPSDTCQLKVLSGTHWAVIAVPRKQPGQSLRLNWTFAPDHPES